MPGKKKVLLIGSIPPPYHGSSIYFQNLLNSEIQNEFEISHLDISDHRDLDNLSKLDLTNVTLAFSNLFSLRKMLKKIKPDLVYIPIASNFLPYLRDGLFILVSNYFSNAKIVIHLHEGDYFRTGFYKNSNTLVKKFIRQSLSKADTAIVLGEGLRTIFEGLVKNTEVVPNGINKVSDSNSTVSKKNNSSQKVRIGFLGNLFESKGVIDVVNASVKVLKKHPDADFVIAGASPSKEHSAKEKAEEIINKNKISEQITFTGFVTGKEKDEFFKKTDIFVFPSWYKYEGFPLVIIEAMSESIPVISAKDIGAIPDIIDNETGILIEKKNPEKLADAINYLIENPEIRINMGKKGKEKFIKFFTLKTNIDNMTKVFNRVFNKDLN